MRVIGLAGWSGAGKTTLIVKLIPELKARGVTVSTLKHAHHAFDIDQPGKDSFEHRAAGAEEVLIVSQNRLALMREFRGAPEPGLRDLLPMLEAVDLVIIEGYKRDVHKKIEVFRQANGKPRLDDDDMHIVGLVSDLKPEPKDMLHADIDDVEAVADLVLQLAEPFDRLVSRLR
jgi:molybdopterin-guanine dinucleotide biosynthesis adapter protein